jgi:ankyrin repeat protein
LALLYQNRQLTGLLDRYTVLIRAASNGHTLMVEQLIAAGAALDVQSSNG